MLDFVRFRHRMLRATTRTDGRPLISPVSGASIERERVPEGAGDPADGYPPCEIRGCEYERLSGPPAADRDEPKLLQ